MILELIDQIIFSFFSSTNNYILIVLFLFYHSSLTSFLLTYFVQDI
jgi:hypothetical protein